MDTTSRVSPFARDLVPVARVAGGIVGDVREHAAHVRHAGEVVDLVNAGRVHRAFDDAIVTIDAGDAHLLALELLDDVVELHVRGLVTHDDDVREVSVVMHRRARAGCGGGGGFGRAGR